MTTVQDALENAQGNFENLGRMGLKGNPIYEIALEQLSNALKAIDNGKGLDDILQESMFGDVDTDEAPTDG